MRTRCRCTERWSRRRKDRGEHNGRVFYGALYGLQYDGGTMQPYLRPGCAAGDLRRGPSGVRRRAGRSDAVGDGGVDLEAVEGLQFTTEASWSDVDSNLPVYDYDRALIEFGLRQTF
ncbi:MAG: hypothetical protein U5R48_16425 [Gammaproteobacteria bacterium]|nr:hypothetical protein [Gammaproteobacteria bacterium]